MELQNVVQHDNEMKLKKELMQAAYEWAMKALQNDKTQMQNVMQKMKMLEPYYSKYKL